MKIHLTLITFGLLWITIPSTNADIESDAYGPKLVIRTPRAISGLWKRFFGRRKQSGFQGSAQTQQPYNVAASTYYPAFVQSAVPVLPFQGPPGFGPAAAVATAGYPYHYPAHFTGFEGYSPLAQASSIYPAFSLPNTFASSAQHGLSSPFDFQSYFEQLLRPVAGSAAAAASGDQETSASTLLSTAVKPDAATAAAAAAAALNFKNLYSFPFQLSSEGSSSPSVGESFNLQNPFGRKHTLRRSSQDKVSNVGYQIQRLISPAQQTKQHKQSIKPSQLSAKSQSIQHQYQKQQYASQTSNDDQVKNQKAYNEQEQQLQNALFNPQEYIASIIQQELAAQQAQLQGKPVDTKSTDQMTSPSEKTSSYYPSSYYYGSGGSLPLAMTKPRAVSNNPTKQVVTKKSNTISLNEPSRPSSLTQSSTSSSSSGPVSQSSYSQTNSYQSQVYKE